MKPLVSIIIPCYNAAPRLAACLYSCLVQTYPEIEILVVDNGSTDGSVEMIKALQMQANRPLRLLSCKTFGANSARTTGFLEANGDYIQWLDADDELAADKVARQVEALEKYQEASLAYGDWTWQFLRSTGSKTVKFQGQTWTDPLLALLIDHWQPPHSYLIRRSATEHLNEHQAWHPQTLVSMDREYFTWAALLGYQFLYVPGSNVTYVNWSPNQITQSRSYPERVQNLRQIFARLSYAAEQGMGKGLTPLHWHFLQQKWQLWQVDLKHPITARWQQSLDSQQLCTIEDHARTVLYKSWQRFLQEYDRHWQETNIEPEQILSKFTNWLGIEIHSQTIELDTAFPWNNADLSTLSLLQLSQTLPLYAPVWNQLRGWLQLHL